MSDTCDRCGAVRPPWHGGSHYFYSRYTDRTECREAASTSAYGEGWAEESWGWGL